MRTTLGNKLVRLDEVVILNIPATQNSSQLLRIKTCIHVIIITKIIVIMIIILIMLMMMIIVSTRGLSHVRDKSPIGTWTEKDFSSVQRTDDSIIGRCLNSLYEVEKDRGRCRTELAPVKPPPLFFRHSSFQRPFLFPSFAPSKCHLEHHDPVDPSKPLNRGIASPVSLMILAPR